MKCLVTLISAILVGCGSYPVAVVVEGNYADYAYSAKGGLVIHPKTRSFDIGGRPILIIPDK